MSGGPRCRPQERSNDQDIEERLASRKTTLRRDSIGMGRRKIRSDHEIRVVGERDVQDVVGMKGTAQERRRKKAQMHIERNQSSDEIPPVSKKGREEHSQPAQKISRSQHEKKHQKSCEARAATRDKQESSAAACRNDSTSAKEASEEWKATDQLRRGAPNSALSEVQK